MNPPSPSVPSLTPELPAFLSGSTPLVFEIRNLPAEPTSIQVDIRNSASPSDSSAEIVGKALNASLYNGGAHVSAAMTYSEGTASFGIGNDHLQPTDPFLRVIVVAGGQTFTFE